MSLDPTLTLRRLLASAYTDAVVSNRARSEVIKALKEEIDREDIGNILPVFLANLEAIVRARTIGERCGDHISQAQLAILKDAMAK